VFVKTAARLISQPNEFQRRCRATQKLLYGGGWKYASHGVHGRRQMDNAICQAKLVAVHLRSFYLWSRSGAEQVGKARLPRFEQQRGQISVIGNIRSILLHWAGILIMQFVTSPPAAAFLLDAARAVPRVSERSRPRLMIVLKTKTPPLLQQKLLRSFPQRIKIAVLPPGLSNTSFLHT
jgi:hypothetical protein